MDAPNALLWVHAVLVLFVGWLVIFVVAWVFPYAWRRIGVAFGLLWSAAPFIADLWAAWVGQPNVPVLVWGWFGVPLWWAVATLNAAEVPGLRALIALPGGLALGLAAAWSGNLLRIFR